MKFIISLLILIPCMISHFAFAGDIERYRIACDDGKVLGCYDLCKAGDGQGCFELGIKYKARRSLKRKFHQAIKYFKKSCEAGLGIGCVHEGILYFEGKGVNKDSSKAVSLFLKGCKLGYIDGCFDLATRYRDGTELRTDKEKAKELFSQACKAGLEKGCSAINQMRAQRRN